MSSVTTIPLHHVEIATYKYRGSSAHLVIVNTDAASDPKPGTVGVSQVQDNVLLKFDSPRRDQYSGVTRATLTRPAAEELVRDLASRLGMQPFA